MEQVPDASGPTAGSNPEHHNGGNQPAPSHASPSPDEALPELPQVLFATGDVMAQQIVERAGLDRHNYARTGRMALYGGGRLHPTLFLIRAIPIRWSRVKNNYLTLSNDLS